MKFQKNYKQYLNPDFLSKIKSLDLKARFVVEGFMIGLHRSPYHGFSVEFSEHRPYMIGDEIQKVDWKIYARTEKYFVKQYEEETNLKCHILVDISKSMSYGSGAISKLEYASILAASLSYLMQNQKDAVGIVLYSDKIDKFLPPKVSKFYLVEIFKILSNLSSSSKTDTFKCLSTVAESIKKRGLIIIISDFLDDIERTISALKQFRYKKNEVIIFQILDEKEINFNFDRDSYFKDLENNTQILTQPYLIRKSYIELFDEFRRKLQKNCDDNFIDYNLITTNNSFDKALFSYLKKRSKLY